MTMIGLRCCIVTATVAVSLSGFAARAQSVSDPQTGLSVTPPFGYEAKPGPSRGRNTAVIDVKRSGDRDTGCKIAFQPVAQNHGFTQAQINELAGTPQRRTVIESTLGILYEVRDVEQIEHDGVRGSAATATFKPIPGLPSRASEMMNVFYLLETPVGRTTVICISNEQDFAGRRSEFDNVVRGVTLPR